MKKFITSIILCLMMLVPLSAKGLDYIRSGEYAYYLDIRGDTNFFRGYMFIRNDANSGLVYIRNVNLVDLKESKIEIEVDDSTDELVIKKIQYVLNFESKELPEDHYQSINDLVNFNSFYHQKAADMGIGGVFEDIWEEYGYSLSYNYCKFLPFFKFMDITRSGDENASYMLNNAGCFNSSEEAKNFFDIGIKAFPNVTRDISKYVLPTAKSTAVKLNGETITLDKNWAKEKKSAAPAYGLYINRAQQASLQVEDLSKVLKSSGLTMDDVIARQLSAYKNIDYSSLVAVKSGTSLELVFIFYDLNGLRNYQFNLFKANGTVVSLSALADIYDANREYFAGIWKSIER